MNRFGQLIHLHLAIRILVRTRLIDQRRDAILFMAIQPGADRAPGKLIGMTR